MKVTIPSQLRSYTAGNKEVEAVGETLREVLADLDRQFAGIRFRIIDEQDRVRRHMVIFVGQEREENLDAKIPRGADIFVIGALSGG